MWCNHLSNSRQGVPEDVAKAIFSLGGSTNFHKFVDGKISEDEWLEIASPFYKALAETVVQQKERLGGTFACSHAVPLRRAREYMRKTAGQDLVFIVLNMTKECQVGYDQLKSIKKIQSKIHTNMLNQRLHDWELGMVIALERIALWQECSRYSSQRMKMRQMLSMSQLMGPWASMMFWTRFWMSSRTFINLKRICYLKNSKQVWPLIQFFSVSSLWKLIDLPGGQINDPSSGKHYSLPFLAATPSSPSRTLDLPCALLPELQRYTPR